MAKKVPREPMKDCGPRPGRMLAAEPPQRLPAAGLNLADLLHLNPASSRMLDSLRLLYWAACQIFEDNLARPYLPRDTLERMQGSLIRQLSQARELSIRLEALGFDAPLKEASALSEYLEATLDRVTKRLRARN